MYVNHNENPAGLRVGDCVIRAISTAMKQPWIETYMGVVLMGLVMHDMPSANHVWGRYLEKNGFKRHIIPDACPDCYTVARFSAEHPSGVYILALSGHVVAIVNGNYVDTWDSGEGIPIYYWKKEGETDGI